MTHGLPWVSKIDPFPSVLRIFIRFRFLHMVMVVALTKSPSHATFGPWVRLLGFETDRNVSSGLEIGGETCFLAFDLRLSCVHAGNDKIFVKKIHIFCTFLTSILAPLAIGHSDHLSRSKWLLRTFLHTSRLCFAVFWRCARTAKKGDSWRRVKTPLLEHSRCTLVRP